MRIPRHQIALLEQMAERERTTVSGVLARELDGLASANADELSASIRGFSSALQWPDADSIQAPC